MNLPDKKTFALAMLAEFNLHLGEGRFNDPVYIARALAVSGLPYEVNGVPTAFCDPYITFLACKVLAVANGAVLTADNAVSVLAAYRHQVDVNYFKTESSVTLTMEAAQERGQWLGVDEIGEDVDILAAWLICYDWGNGDRHIGMVKVDQGDSFTTDEANTSCPGHPSGVIAQKGRDWSFILGFVRLY